MEAIFKVGYYFIMLNNESGLILFCPNATNLFVAGVFLSSATGSPSSAS